MEGFRTICFIHKAEHSYHACGIRQFFKWIGFSYFSFLPGSLGIGLDILKKPENQDFDIVVNMNRAAQENGSDISELFGNRWIDLEFKENEPIKDIMDHLISKIYEIVPGSRSDVIDELYRIYHQFDMAEVVYEYTCVLLKLAEKELYDLVLEKYESIIQELDKSEPRLEISGKMMEYFLFAKYCCYRNVNGLYELQKWSYEYPVKELINNIDRIYEYDPDFYRAEYLKAKASEQSIMEQVYAKQFFYKCIKNSRIEVCKSYLYYHLGKWQERGRQIVDAQQSYKKAYQLNPASMKAVFKLAVYAKKAGDSQTEAKYLNLIIDFWKLNEKNKCRLTLMDVEYVYKAYMLLDDAKRVNMQDLRYYSAAQEVLDFTKDLCKNAEKNSFIKRLYGNKVKYVCKAMSGRMDIKCLFNNKVWKNNYGRVNVQK